MTKQNVANYLNTIGAAIGAEFYFVGGTVRDDILGLEIKDWDCVARGLPFEELISQMSVFGRTETTGEQFNVIRHFPDREDLPQIEIALPRKEVSSGVGHKDFDARYDHNMPIEEDLARRDYTVNSMAENCLTGEIIDPYGGIIDLREGRLHLLHIQSAEEDPLRIIRGFRFIAKFGFKPSFTTLHQWEHNLNALAYVSKERFQKEILELLVAPYADEALRGMENIGALAKLFPELQRCVGCTQNRYHDFDVWEHTVRVVKNTPTKDPYVKLAALFHDIAKPVVKWIDEGGEAHFYKHEDYPHSGAHELVGADIARDIMNRLKFSSHNASRVSLLVKEHMFIQGDNLGPKAARRFLSRLEGSPGGTEANLKALFAIREGDLRGGKAKFSEELLQSNRQFLEVCRAELAAKTAFKITDLAINGHDAMSLGFFGPDIGKLFKLLLELVIEFPEDNTKDSLVVLALEYKAVSSRAAMRKKFFNNA